MGYPAAEKLAIIRLVTHAALPARRVPWKRLAFGVLPLVRTTSIPPQTGPGRSTPLDIFTHEISALPLQNSARRNLKKND